MDVLQIVLQNISARVTRSSLRNPATATRALASLSATCKNLHTLIDDDVWRAAWSAYLEVGEVGEDGTRSCPYFPTLSYKENLLLHAHIGCQFCKAPRIRKIHTAFAVRCCTDCLHKRTISSWRLQNEFMVPAALYNTLPHTDVEMYSRHRTGQGPYQLQFYWLESVTAKLGMSVEEHLSTVKRAEEERRCLNDEHLADLVVDLPFDVDFVLEHTTYAQVNAATPLKVDFLAILERARDKHDQVVAKQEMDEHIKVSMKSHHPKLTLTDIRSTTTYRSKVSRRAYTMEAADWTGFMGDIVAKAEEAFKKKLREAAPGRLPDDSLQSILRATFDGPLTMDNFKASRDDLAMQQAQGPLRDAIAIKDAQDALAMQQEQERRRARQDQEQERRRARQDQEQERRRARQELEGDSALYKPCPVCGGSRRFKQGALQQHAMAVHPAVTVVW